MVAPISMKAQSINSNVIMPVDVKEYPSHYEYHYETEAGSGKKWGVGIASAFLPGLGQAINGQWGKGIGFFAGTGVLSVAATLSGALGMAKESGKGIAGMLACLLGSSALAIWSIVDAVKNAKEVTKQIVPKQEQQLNTQV